MSGGKLNLRRQRLLVEAPQSAATDIAFILIIFFLVCASVQPDTGREQLVPRSEEQPEKSKQSQNVEVSISNGAVVVNGNIVEASAVKAKMTSLLAGRARPEDRVVVVKSAPTTAYERWIDVTGQIESAGGVVTLRLDKQRELKF